jgi:uncharacterized protein
MADEHDPTESAPPDSLLPYETWTEEAFRGVAVRAIEHVARHGLPGEHHFYITFRTDHPATVIPPRLRARFPDEMTVVLQHKFWDLAVDQTARTVSVGLSFGGIASTLIIPFDSMTGFADPSVKWGLRFTALLPEATETPDPAPASPVEPAPDDATTADDKPQVVSLDAFRRRRD